MNQDDFEQRLQQQHIRQIPDGWREGILHKAEAAASSRPSTLDSRPALLSTLNSQLSTLLRPCPRAWAALAAIWVGILAVQFSLRDKPGTVARQTRASEAQVAVALEQQRHLLSELIGQSSASEAGAPKAAPPRPRSDRQPEMQMA